MAVRVVLDRMAKPDEPLQSRSVCGPFEILAYCKQRERQIMAAGKRVHSLERDLVNGVRRRRPFGQRREAVYLLVSIDSV